MRGGDRGQQLGQEKPEKIIIVRSNYTPQFYYLKLSQLPYLHLIDLVSIVLLPEGGVEALIDTLGVQHQADGEQDRHLVSLLVDLVDLVGVSDVGKPRENKVHQIPEKRELATNPT